MTELPTTFGKYYLTEKLATGGMAEIYLAKIIGPGGFEKPLVIKKIHPQLSGNRHFVDLFVAEAKTLVTLAHGNIVPVYELGVVDDTYFIAMDYIDGPTLYRLTETMARREGLMEPALAAWITARILEGLDYAHRKGEGVIHRDLSPRNVMLSRDGEVKLVDFGIAVTLGEPGEAEGAQSAPTGSFPYMSPEQVRREALSGQTDLFSVGVLFWEMLAGRRLFARAGAEATLEAVLAEDIPRPSSVRADVPAKLEEVVMRALERDQAARWPSAGDMLAPLNKYLYSLDETPGPRDAAALVARFCPPETRRLPTHLEAVAQDVIVPEPVSQTGGDLAEPPAASGPRTAVIPRDGSQPRGKPQRQTSFATNVDLKALLDRSTPLLPFDAIDDAPTKEDRPQSPRVDTPLEKPTDRRSRPSEAVESAEPEPAPRPARRSRPMDTVDDSPEEPVARPIRRSRQRPAVERDDARTVAEARPFGADAADKLRQPPSRRLLVIGGLGAIALAAVSIYMFYRGRERVLASMQDAAVESPRDATEAPVDAVPVITPPRDAAIEVDAGRDPKDAGVRRGDASPARSADAGVDAAARGTATLQIGADPWGEIYIDGKPMGRTPRELVVPAGRHTVEIVFPAEQPPRKQTFTVDLASGDVKPLQADFK
jgi:serine/threonine-protein kinase